MDQPVIAAVNGHAVGAGCDLALACDIRIASDRAKFGAVYTTLGYVPDVGATYFFPRLVGVARACELIFTGDIIDAREAERIGLVNRVVPHYQLEEETKKLATRLAKGATLAIAMAKNAIYRGLNIDLATELDYEGYLASVSLHTEDLKEGLEAFIEKRKPNFKGK
jgi:2-(1,2-epoxy-1,2-dihydrophenyl)acetyl-CoA isomerase